MNRVSMFKANVYALLWVILGASTGTLANSLNADIESVKILTTYPIIVGVAIMFGALLWNFVLLTLGVIEFDGGEAA